MTTPKVLGALRRLFADTRGASAVEYGLIVSAVMLAIFAGLSQLGVSLQGLMTFISGHLASVG